MGFLDFFKGKKKTTDGKVYTGLQGLIIDSLEKSGDENVEIIKAVFNEMEKEKKEEKPITTEQIEKTVKNYQQGNIKKQEIQKETSLSNNTNDNLELTLTEAEQLLLSKFLHPTDISSWYERDYLSFWNAVLPRKIKDELDYLIKKNILVEEKSLAFKLEYKSDSELKKILKENGLKVSGSKTEKAIRIAENLPELAKNIVIDKKLYKCSDKVMELVKNYKANIEKLKIETLEKIFLLCSEFNYEKALQKWRNYNKKLVFREDENLNKNHCLFCMKIIMEYVPKALDGIPENLLLDARKMAIKCLFTNEAMRSSAYYQTNYKYPLNVCAGKLSYFANNKFKIYQAQQYIEKGKNAKIKILGCENGCIECQYFNQKIYDINNVPEVPNPKCTHEYGCRCTYTIIL